MTGLRFVVAFKTEAMPIIEYFGLKQKKPPDEFPVFKNNQHALVLSGPGKAAVIAATNHLCKVSENTPDTFWLNIGIAGHPDLPIGTVVLASHISDSGSGESWATQQTFTGHLPASHLLTVTTPETHYRQKALYDMEAAGFYSTAVQFTQADRVQCLKVVSDNKDSPVHEFSARQASRLMQQAQPALISFLETLLEQDSLCTRS
jgi:hypothetical protein